MSTNRNDKLCLQVLPKMEAALIWQFKPQSCVGPKSGKSTDEPLGAPANLCTLKSH